MLGLREAVGDDGVLNEVLLQQLVERGEYVWRVGIGGKLRNFDQRGV